MLNGRAGLYYRSIKNQIDKADLERLLLTIDAAKREQILRKRHEEDRIRSLLGISLIEQASKDFGVESFDLANLVFPDKEKPYFSGDSSWNFNVSHSGEHVVCFSHPDHHVGVDVEVYSQRDASKFTRYFSESEKAYASQSSTDFTRVWTAKEAVAKGIGQGIKLLSKIELNLDTGMAQYDDQVWRCEWHELHDAIVCAAIREKQ